MKALYQNPWAENKQCCREIYRVKYFFRKGKRLKTIYDYYKMQESISR